MSRPPRFFISPEQAAGSRIIVSGEDVRHIVSVLRMKPGEMLLLCDGKGAEYTVKIAQVGQSEIATELVSQSRRDIRYPFVTLVQGLPKSDKMDFIVQKATELGVTEIIPLKTERTIVKVKDEEKRITRWQKIAREAAMQSNRVDIPFIGQIVSFKDFLRTPNPELRTLLLLPWEEGTLPIKDVLRAHADVKKIIVLIGPEGGFSTLEAETAKARGFHLVSLGPHILRTETAAVATLSMILYETSANNQITDSKE
jgi:16S rRNA (uracil1498-N3)-methyltransferase